MLFLQRAGEVATPRRLVDLRDESEVAETAEWWRQLQKWGGEGVVVKPAPFHGSHPRGCCIQS